MQPVAKTPENCPKIVSKRDQIIVPAHPLQWPHNAPILSVSFICNNSALLTNNHTLHIKKTIYVLSEKNKNKLKLDDVKIQIDIWIFWFVQFFGAQIKYNISHVCLSVIVIYTYCGDCSCPLLAESMWNILILRNYKMSSVRFFYGCRQGNAWRRLKINTNRKIPYNVEGLKCKMCGNISSTNFFKSDY